MEKIKIKTKHNLSFILKKNSYLLRFSLMIGALKTYKLDNKEFNKNIYIECKSDIVYQSINNNPKIQELLIELFTMNVSQLDCKKNNLYLSFKTIKNNPQGIAKRDKITKILNNINEILWELPSANLPKEKSKITGNTTAILIVCFVPFIFLCHGIATDKLVSLELLKDLFKYTGILYLIFCIFYARTFSGIAKTISAIWNAVLIFCIILFCITGVAAFINVYLDNSPSEIKYLTMVEHERGMSRRLIGSGSSNFYCMKAVDSLSDAKTQYKLISDGDLYSKTKVGSKVQVTFRNGFFGYQWIDKQSAY